MLPSAYVREDMREQRFLEWRANLAYMHTDTPVTGKNYQRRDSKNTSSSGSSFSLILAEMRERKNSMMSISSGGNSSNKGIVPFANILK